MATQKEKDAAVLQQLIRLDPKFKELSDFEQKAVDGFIDRVVDPQASIFNVENQSRAELNKIDGIVFDKLAPELNQQLEGSGIELIPEASQRVSNRNLELEGIRRARPERPRSADTTDPLDRVIRSGDIGRETDPRRRAELREYRELAEERDVPLTQRFIDELKAGDSVDVQASQQPVLPEDPKIQVAPMVAVNPTQADLENPEFVAGLQQAPELSLLNSEGPVASAIPADIGPDTVNSLPITSNPDPDLNMPTGGGGLGGFMNFLFGL